MNIHVDGTKINQTNHNKIKCVNKDKNLSWKEHVHAILRKVSSMIFQNILIYFPKSLKCQSHIFCEIWKGHFIFRERWSIPPFTTLCKILEFFDSIDTFGNTFLGAWKWKVFPWELINTRTDWSTNRVKSSPHQHSCLKNSCENESCSFVKVFSLKLIYFHQFGYFMCM